MTTNGLYAMIYPTFINENMHIMHTILDIQSGIQCKNTFSRIFFIFWVFFCLFCFTFLKVSLRCILSVFKMQYNKKTKNLKVIDRSATTQQRMKKYQMEQKEEFLDISTYQMLYLKAKFSLPPAQQALPWKTVFQLLMVTIVRVCYYSQRQKQKKF